jgi:hypothetical protein
MSSLLPCLTYLLLKHPKVLGRLRQEIRSAFAPEGPDITTDTLLRLSYLGACISEALRMYPPFVQGNDRVVPPGGASVSGLHSPEGPWLMSPILRPTTRVSIGSAQTLTIQRDGCPKQGPSSSVIGKLRSSPLLWAHRVVPDRSNLSYKRVEHLPLHYNSQLQLQHNNTMNLL